MRRLFLFVFSLVVVAFTATGRADISTAASALKKRQWTDAAREAGDVLATDPKNPEALRIRGFARARLKDYPGSLADFDAALALAPDDDALWLGRARTRRFMDTLPSALDDIRHALALAPQKAPAHVEEGVILFSMGDYPAAAKAYEKANVLDPALPGMNAYLEQVYLFLREPAQARAAAEEGIRREPTFGVHKINLAHAALFAGDMPLARKLYLTSADLIDMDGVTPGRVLVKQDFAKMRAAGILVPGMDEIETLLAKKP